ncbi:MAG: hypothetical protein JNK67_28000 [Alphaproteobacteria bacterium]|nr:hypothetical protein [Alphaproteobacteria bacterium]
MADKIFAAVVTAITWLGLAAGAEARCGGQAVLGHGNAAVVAPAGAVAAPASGFSGGNPIDVWVPALHQGILIWVPLRYWPNASPVVLPGDDLLAAHRRDGTIPVDANGMPRRRC